MSKLQKILVRARKQVFSEMVGNNPSIFKGEGYDFIELREYMPGDDIRHIDWNITAKMQRPFIKVFKEERELNVVLVSILNGSVHFGSHRFKQEAIAEIIALLGFSTLKNGDLLSAYSFSDRLLSHAKPSKKLFSVQKIVESILEFNALNEGLDFKLIAQNLFARLQRKSLILMVGDFFEIPDLRLLAKKHEVIAVVVRDHIEENPPVFGFASLIDPQSGVHLEGDFNAASVAAYSAKVKAHDRELFERLRKDGIRFTKIYTSDNTAVGLRRLFEAR